MATRSQIEEAKQSVQESQSQIETSREQLSEQLSSLQQKKRVPFTSRKERFQRLKYKKSLGQSQQELQSAKQEIQQYQQQVLKPAESELQNIEEYNAAVKTIERAAEKGMVWAHALYGEGIVKKLARQYESKRKITGGAIRVPTEEGFEWTGKQDLIPEYVDASGQGISYDPNLAGGISDYKQFEVPIPAYYDPKTGQEIMQSIDPSIAKGLGYVKVDATAFSPSTGKYMIESPTGLLTPSQQSYQKIIQAIRPDLKRIKTPTTFEFGGSKEEPNILDIMGGPTTSYEAAAKSSAYVGQKNRAIDYARLGPEGFYNKYGYDVTPEGIKLASGGVTRPFGEYDSTPFERSLNLAVTLTGAKAGYQLLKGVTKPLLKSTARSGGFIFSDPISKATTGVVDLIIPSRETGFQITGAPRQVARGLLFGGLAFNPLVGTAYVSELTKEGIKDPIGTGTELLKYAKENPYEIGTMTLMGAAKGREYKLNKKAVKIIKENIKELDKAKIAEVTYILKGAGKKIGSSRVEMVIFQETANGVRKTLIEGDLINQKGNVYFFPEGKGISTTVSVAKPKGGKTRIYQDAQTFEVGGKSTGINMGQIGNVQVFTPTGTSTFVPGSQRYALVKKKFGPFAEARTLREITRQLEKKPTYGGQVIKDITLPFQDIGFKINEQVSFLVGERGAGVILTPEQVAKNIGKKYTGGSRTPLSQTFQEVVPEVVPLDKVSKNVGKQSAKLVNSLVPTQPSLVGIPRAVGGAGLTESQLASYKGQSNFLISYEPVAPKMDVRSVRNAPTISSLITPTLQTKQKSKLSIKQTQIEKQRSLEREKLIESQKKLQRQREIQKQKQLQRQKQLQKQKQLQRQKQLQKQKQAFENALGIDFTGGTPSTAFGFKPERDLKIKKRKVDKRKEKKKVKQVLPTLTQQLTGQRRKTPIKYITGFEIARV